MAYYVSATGSDLAAGTQAAPFLTIAKAVSSIAGAAGQTIYLRQGDTFRELVTLASNTITVTAYGTGNLPIVSGADLVTGWTSIGASQYTATVAVKPGHVIVDGIWMQEVATAGAVVAGCWHHTGTTLTVRMFASDDPVGHVVEGSQRNQCIKALNKAGGRLYRVHVRAAKLYGWHNQCTTTALSDGWTIEEVDATLCRDIGLFTDASTIAIGTTTYLNCTSSRNGRKGMELYGLCADGEIDGCTSTRDGMDPAERVSPASSDSRAGIDIIASDLLANDPASVVERATNCSVHDCEVSYAGVAGAGEVQPHSAITGTGIWFDHPGLGCEAFDNVSHHNLSRGMNLEAAPHAAGSGYTNARFYRNRVFSVRNVVTGQGTGIIFSRYAHNCLVANNTIYDCDWGIWTQSYAGGADPVGFSDNRIANNIVDGCTRALVTREGGGNDGTEGSGNLYDHNCFDAEFSNFIDWNTALKSTYAAWTTAASATVTDGYVNATPLLTNPANGNYTLALDSPCRQVGTSISGVTIQTPPDLGAYPDVIDSAYRISGALTGWVGIVGRHTTPTTRLAGSGLDPAQLDEWERTGLGGQRNWRGWAPSWQRLKYCTDTANGREYTDGSIAIPNGTGADTDLWMWWRGITYFETVGFCPYVAARDMESIMVFWASNDNIAHGGYETPFARWENDTDWGDASAGTGILGEIKAFARACASQGFVGVGIDGEPYGYTTSPYGNTLPGSWSAGYHGRTPGLSEPQVQALVKQRGREVAGAIQSEMPQAVWWSYHTLLSRSQRAYEINFTATGDYGNQFVAGICQMAAGFSRIHIAEPGFFKGASRWGSQSYANWCDAVRYNQMGCAMSVCEQLSDAEWDACAAKLYFSPFVWLTAGASIYEPRLTLAQAQNAMRATRDAAAGGWVFIYPQGSGGYVEPPGDPTGTGNDYDEYEPLFAEFEPGVGADTTPPACTITTNGGAGFTIGADKLDLAGTAVGGTAPGDGGKHAIHRVTWSNAGTGASGECRIAFVITTPNFQHPPDPIDFGKPPQNGVRLTWRIDWSKTATGDRPILLAYGANLITITAYDVHGNTHSDTITVTRSFGPPAFYVQSAASQTSGTGTVTVTLPALATAGNLLVAVYRLATGGGGLFLISPHAGFEMVHSDSDDLDGFHLLMYMARANGDEQVFTWSQATGTPNVDLCVIEFAGFTGAVKDKSGANDPVGTANTSCATGTTGTLDQADELAVAAVALSAANSGSEAVDSSFTIVHTAELSRMLVAYRTVSATTALNPTFSWATGLGALGLIVTFEDPAPGGRSFQRARQVPFFASGRSAVRTG